MQNLSLDELLMPKSSRGACESCASFIKVGKGHSRFFICQAWDWRSMSSHTYTSCPYFNRKKYSRKEKHKEEYEN